MVKNERNAFTSLLGVTAQIVIHHYNPYEISFPTIYVTGLSSTERECYLVESFITVKNSMNSKYAFKSPYMYLHLTLNMKGE